MPYTLPPLSFDVKALEPHIDGRTMEIHHGKHHQAYITNVNAALKDTPYDNKPIDDLMKELNSIPENIRTVVRNNGGGHANHTLFWTILSPKGGGMPTGDLADAITKACGSIDAFREQLAKAAMTRFGSGWGWLSVKADGSLVVESTANQDTPLSDGRTPILGLDVWEHAYYLHYQNRRADYISAFWNVVNWPEVARRYAAAKG